MDNQGHALGAGGEEVRRPAGQCFDDRGDVVVLPVALAVDGAAPETVGNGNEDVLQGGLGFLDLAQGLVPFADVAGGDQGHGPGTEVQPGHGQVDRDPEAVLRRAQEEALLGVKHLGFEGRLPQPAHAALAAEAEQVGGREAHQLLEGKAGQLLGRGVDVEKLIGLRIEEEEGIAGFLEQGLSQFRGVNAAHSVCRSLHAGESRVQSQEPEASGSWLLTLSSGLSMFQLTPGAPGSNTCRPSPESSLVFQAHQALQEFRICFRKTIADPGTGEYAKAPDAGM